VITVIQRMRSIPGFSVSLFSWDQIWCKVDVGKAEEAEACICWRLHWKEPTGVPPLYACHCCSWQFFYIWGEWESNHKAQRVPGVHVQGLKLHRWIFRAPFLMVQGRPPAGAPNEVRMTVRVDTLDWTTPSGKMRMC